MALDFSKLEGACLAPMAGVSDSPFRAICRGCGALFTVTEMVSAKALCYQDKKSRALMRITEAERPCGIQLFGSEPSEIARAVRIAAECSPDFIDLNFGCPVPKVAASGSGALLLKTPLKAIEIMKAAADASPVPVTVKLRKGWDSSRAAAPEIALAAEAAGISAITVHGRTASQGYRPPVDYEIIRRIRESVKIPVIANGDVFKAEDAAKVRELTGCRLVMVARGAMGDPLIFTRIRELDAGAVPSPPRPEELMRLFLRQCRLSCESFGERRGILEMRKHAGWYIKGVPGASELRRRAFCAVSFSDMLAIASDAAPSLASGEMPE